MPLYKLQINGTYLEANVEDDTPMLWVLRDELKLKGTKFGCGIAQCGACTIHLDGDPVRSCSLPVSTVGDKEITTIEGLSAEGDHPVQRAWMHLDVPQCGYCQAGQIMSAAALLDKKSKPSQKEIDQAMAGNICRCGTYPKIKSAILKASNQGGEL